MKKKKNILGVLADERTKRVNFDRRGIANAMLAAGGYQAIIDQRNTAIVSGPESFKPMGGFRVLPIRDMNPLRWPRGGSIFRQ
jgi:hypothetical protein